MLRELRLVATLCAACFVLYASGAWAQCSARDVLQNASVPTFSPVIAPSAVVRTGDIPKVWKTITLGAFANSFALRNALDAAGCGIGDLAEEILARPAFTLASSKTEVDLVAVSAADLGLAVESTSLKDIYSRAEKLGLSLAPAEVGPELRLQYFKQPTGEFLNIGMRPITTWNGDLVIFTVANGGAGLILIGKNAGAENSNSCLVHLFVCAAPRATKSSKRQRPSGQNSAQIKFERSNACATKPTSSTLFVIPLLFDAFCAHAVDWRLIRPTRAVPIGAVSRSMG